MVVTASANKVGSCAALRQPKIAAFEGGFGIGVSGGNQGKILAGI
jgi:hypothetical protein